MNKTIKRIGYILLIVILCLIVFINHNDIYKFILDVISSINRTLIVEKRYLLFLKGFYATMIISLFSILFGTILGFILFITGKSIKTFNKISTVIIRILQGIPITVLLLIFYYVVFGSIDINPIIVAIITFSIYFSAYTAELFKGAYTSINRNQIYSAYSLGFTKMQTLRFIVLPQVLAYMIPVYKNEVVTLIKLTSIASYISIVDLTKASDIIRNRTYEAFFPLIFTAFIYFIICILFSKLLDFVYKRINHREGKK